MYCSSNVDNSLKLVEPQQPNKSKIDGANIKYSDNKIVAYNDIYTIIQSSIELNNDNESKFIKIVPYLDLTECGGDIPKIKIRYDQFETELSLEIKSLIVKSE